MTEFPDFNENVRGSMKPNMDDKNMKRFWMEEQIQMFFNLLGQNVIWKMTLHTQESLLHDGTYIWALKNVKAFT